MQEKRNIRLLILLAVLVMVTGVVYYIFNFSTRSVVDKSLFKLADFAVIDKVILTKSERKTELVFDGARWKVNDQLADPGMIDVLFATLQQAEPKHPIAEALQDSISDLLDKGGVNVSLFEGDTPQLEFIVGGNANKTQAYFKNLEDRKVYVMIIPGYRVYTSGIFELETNGWKDRYVFNFNWKNFKSLRASFPADTKNNFEVAMGDVYFKIDGMAAVDTTKLNDFLDAISLIQVDEYVSRDLAEQYDSLINSQPFLNIIVDDISGRSYSLALYGTTNPVRVLGVIHKADLAFIGSQKIEKLLKERAWFVKSE